MFKQAKADYTYQMLKGNVIAIINQNKGGKSVTNDIENVLAEIAKSEHITLAEYKIMYKDSEGDWTGVIQGSSIGFFFIGDRRMSMNEAKDKLLQK